jgi:hypothetical protein
VFEPCGVQAISWIGCLGCPRKRPHPHQRSFTVTIYPDGTKLKKVRAAKKKKADVYWYAQPVQINGYQIQAAKNKTFKKAKSYTVKVASGTKAGKTLHKTLKLSTGTWYIRVRTYKTCSGKKVYSSWSSSKKVKIRR